MKRLASLVLALSLVAGTPAFASEPPPRADAPLSDPSQEARAKALFSEIRCVVCQHESIIDSPASIAADMRWLVREQITAGASDDEIQQDLVRRYGDYVLFKPPFKGSTLILWLGPFALVLGTGGLFWLWSRRRRESVAPLSAAEEAELARELSESEHPKAKLPDN